MTLRSEIREGVRDTRAERAVAGSPSEPATAPSIATMLTSGPTAARHSQRSVNRLKRGPFPLLAVVPAVVLVVVLMMFPIVSTIYHSFTAWNGTATRFIGIENFRLLWQDPTMREVLLNSLIFLTAVPAILVSSLVAAVLVYEQVIGWRIFRLLFFVPGVLSPVVVGALFSTFVLPHGLANLPLRIVGLPPIQWLAAAWPARLVVMAALVWTSFGFGMIVLLSGMSTIDPSVYEAAKIDGATWWRRLRSITLPLVSGTLQFLSVVNVIYTFTALFGFVFVITGGGPGFATTTIDYYTYTTTFESGNFGYGSALAVVLFVIVAILTIVQLKLFPQESVQHGS